MTSSLPSYRLSTPSCSTSIWLADGADARVTVDNHESLSFAHMPELKLPKEMLDLAAHIAGGVERDGLPRRGAGIYAAPGRQPYGSPSRQRGC